MTGHEVNLRSLLIPGKKLSEDNLVAAVEWALGQIDDKTAAEKVIVDRGVCETWGCDKSLADRVDGIILAWHDELLAASSMVTESEKELEIAKRNWRVQQQSYEKLVTAI